jgi:hypothetical protein
VSADVFWVFPLHLILQAGILLNFSNFKPFFFHERMILNMSAFSDVDERMSNCDNDVVGAFSVRWAHLDDDGIFEF